MGDISREVVPSQSEEAVGAGQKVDGSREVLDGRAERVELDRGRQVAPEVADRFDRGSEVARVSVPGEDPREGTSAGSPADRLDDDAGWEPVDGDGEPEEAEDAAAVPTSEADAEARADDGDGASAPTGDLAEEAPSESPVVESPIAESPGDGAEAGATAAETAETAETTGGADEEPAPEGRARSAPPLPDVPAIEGIDHLSRVLMTLLLAAREGASMLRLAQSCDVSQKAVAEGLDHLTGFLTEQGLPLELARSGEHVRLLSTPETFPYLQRLRGVKKTERLSQAALETLAVIAYRQPVIRAEIEAIRGVKAGPILRTLLDHKLVAVTGRADVPGRPLQYGTTQEFLERFGLSSLKDLPSVKEFKQLG